LEVGRSGRVRRDNIKTEGTICTVAVCEQESSGSGWRPVSASLNSLQRRIDTLKPYRYRIVSEIAYRCIDNIRYFCLFPPGGLQSPFGRDRDVHRAPSVGGSQTSTDDEGELWAAGQVGEVQTAS
jgi:hypothetical protein